MRNGNKKMLAAICAMLFALQGVAFAGVEVSVTLTGDLDEILSVLNALNAQRGGNAVGQSNESMRVQVHSMSVGTIEDGPRPSPVPPTQQPQIAFSGAEIVPSTPSPGGQIMVMAELQDPRHQVDTVSVRLNVPGGFAFDLFDNGGYGDNQAGDGLWKRQITLPADIAPGDVTVAFTAFDMNGQTVNVIKPDGTSAPLKETATLRIMAPQAAGSASSVPENAAPSAAAPSPDQ